MDQNCYGPDGELFQMFHRISKLKMSALFDELTHMEFVTLLTLEKNKKSVGKSKMKISDIASLTKARSSAVSRTLNGLEAKGYIVRSTDVADRRNTYVELTDEGSRIMQECNMRINNFFSTVFEGVGKENMEQFIETLHKIHDISQEELDKRIHQKNQRSD